ncbi:hypothetical protein scyTo_0016248 [Scyliorhinus torazame]|uniref:Uncharacterized protein n=1 Tax=Scyliorhinus torazame TaxID=75743 RepID=A0A401Q5C3_SCYTO|nr:hypothetical protein [Scyliorhinus torazame]
MEKSICLLTEVTLSCSAAQLSNEFRKRGRSLKILADFAKTVQIQLPNETFHAVSFKNPRGTAALQHLFLKGLLIYNYTVSTIVPPDGRKLIALNDFPEFFREDSS